MQLHQQIVVVLLCLCMSGMSALLPPSVSHGIFRRSTIACINCKKLARESLYMSSEDTDNKDTTEVPLTGFSKFLSNFNLDKSDVISYAISFAIAFSIRAFLVEPRFIPSLSMFPTFEVGDQLLVDKIGKTVRPYQKRDVVVFNPPEAYTIMTGNTEALIKRIVAVGGDRVEVRDRHLYVNGVMQVENYINDSPDYQLPEATVPKGMMLVLGDNRNKSFDSHIWGFLPERNIIGRAVIKYWPPQRIGLIEGSM